MDRRKMLDILRFSLLGLLLISYGCAVAAAETKKDPMKDPAVMSQAELQSQVMAFADRYFSIMVSAYSVFEAQTPPAETQKQILNICTYSASAAFTIAAQPNPVGAFLDMAVMVTLGRIIFEENLLPQYGPQLQPLVAGFREAESDIWRVAAKIGTLQQQQELRALIEDWRKNNPNILYFPSVRFGDFSAKRAGPGKKEAGGLFQSVSNATQTVEETRLLAERGMFLATRMPLLTGLFGGIWFSQMARSPDIGKVLKDINTFSQVSERLAAVAEQLPDRIAVERDTTIKEAMANINALTSKTIDQTVKAISRERQATIEQVMQGISNERKSIVADFNSEEARMRVLLSELRVTLAEGNKVLVSADGLVKGLNLAPPAAQAGPPGKPFDILEYQDTLKEATRMIVQVNDLMNTVDKMGLKSMLPQVVAGFEQVQEKGQEWVLFAFFLGIALILVFLVGSVVAALVYRHYALRIYGSSAQPIRS